MGIAPAQLTAGPPVERGASDQLREHREVWATKAALRTVYHDYYRRVVAACRGPSILEIGGGTGNLKEFVPHLLATDIQYAPWLDLVADAQSLPFGRESLDSIVVVDVLHHVERPRRFFDEAMRVLRPGGRLVILDPAITLGSWFFFHFLHPEPVVLSDDPLTDAPTSAHRDPWDANQAVATILFSRMPRRFSELYPRFRIVRREWFSFLAYPLSGGFRRWSLLPQKLAGPLVAMENTIAPLLGRVIGFRILVVLEKVATNET